MANRSRLSNWISMGATLFVLPMLAALALDHAASASTARKGRFFDAPSQAAEYIGYNRSITLSPEQRKTREKALSAMAAPCCKKFSMATCCCPCNLAKSVWGLTNSMIVRESASPAQIQTAVRGWLKFVNAQGFTGDLCDTAGGCAREFSRNGCGGMDERNLMAAR
jgi:hypothetical protein